jgi:hypothetical protein
VPEAIEVWDFEKVVEKKFLTKMPTPFTIHQNL